MAPFADAMRLVDGEEADLDVPEELGVLLLGEALRRHIQDLGAPIGDVLAHAQGLVPGEGTVQEMRHALLVAEAPKGIHLVLHQGDQRAHHDGGPFHHDGGKLVAEALASASGHDHEGVAPIEDALHDGLLLAFELLEAEELLERRFGRQVDVDHHE